MPRAGHYHSALHSDMLAQRCCGGGTGSAARPAYSVAISENRGEYSVVILVFNSCLLIVVAWVVLLQLAWVRARAGLRTLCGRVRQVFAITPRTILARSVLTEASAICCTSAARTLPLRLCIGVCRMFLTRRTAGGSCRTPSPSAAACVRAAPAARRQVCMGRMSLEVPALHGERPACGKHRALIDSNIHDRDMAPPRPLRSVARRLARIESSRMGPAAVAVDGRRCARPGSRRGDRQPGTGPRGTLRCVA